MANSPQTCPYREVDALFDANNCAALLQGAHIDLIDSAIFDPPLSGTAEYRFEQHTSRDGRCVAQYDIYVSATGRELRFIYTLELDGTEYVALYDRPRLMWDEL